MSDLLSMVRNCGDRLNYLLFKAVSTHIFKERSRNLHLKNLFFYSKKFVLSKKNLVMLEFLEKSTLVTPLLSQDLYNVIRKYLVRFLHFATV